MYNIYICNTVVVLYVTTFTHDILFLHRHGVYIRTYISRGQHVYK